MAGEYSSDHRLGPMCVPGDPTPWGIQWREDDPEPWPGFIAAIAAMAAGAEEVYVFVHAPATSCPTTSGAVAATTTGVAAWSASATAMWSCGMRLDPGMRRFAKSTLLPLLHQMQQPLSEAIKSSRDGLATPLGSTPRYGYSDGILH